MIADCADDIYARVVAALAEAGKDTPYDADANEPDPAYKGYGVRAQAMKALLREFNPELAPLDIATKLALAERFIDSGFGEQKSFALHLCNQMTDYFVPSRFDLLDGIVRRQRGWSKIDSYCGTLLKALLEAYPKEMLALARRWNKDEDLWMRRASVVLFTRKVGASGRYTDVALEFCDRLKHDPEDMVRKGVGWCLKDVMRADKHRVIEYVKALRREGVSSVVTLYAIRDLKGAERKSVLSA